MKKKIIALFLIVLLVLGCSCQKATLEDYKLFRSTPLGISVEYPDYWEKTQDNKNGIVAFVTPTEGYADDYLDNFSVQRFTLDMEGETAYSDYVKGYVANLESTLANYNLVSEEETTLGGEEAYKIVYESTSDDKKSELRFMQLFAEHEGQIYVATFVAEFTAYSYFVSHVEQMLTTFTFI